MKNLVVENKTHTIASRIDHSLSPVPHFHRHIELVYVIDGESYANADRKNFKLNKGDMFFTFPNQIHYYNTVVNGDYLLIIFTPDILYGLNDILFDNIPNTNVISAEQCPNLLNLSLEIYKKGLEYEDTLKVGILNQLIATILPHLKLKTRIKTGSTTLQEVLNFCSSNFSNDITLEDIADALHISKFHISHLLNNKLGINFNSYINNLRINRACDMLEDTEAKISDISEDVGFGSIRSFNRAFKDTMNTTPLEYRSQFKKGNPKNTKRMNKIKIDI